MIIRRKHTANFTTIGNVLFNDERLAADEVGVLAYLLSRPHDWEVRRPALARRWRLGRDSIKRIIQSAMRTGWIVAHKTRLSNGTFHIVYEVRDEPGSELSPEEIKAALSLVSSGAGHDETDGDEGQEPTELGSDTGDPPPTENPSWSAGQPSLVQPSTANPSRSIKTLQNTDSQRTESPNCARAYADLKKIWPPENVLSDAASEKAFLDLTDQQTIEAVDRAPAYLDDCKAQNRKVCDLKTFIHERRWERFKPRPAKPSLVVVKVNTPQWHRWRHYLVETNGNVARFDQMGRSQYGGMAMPSEWPPSTQQIAKTV